MKSSDLRLKTIETRNGAWGHIERFIDWKTSENSFSLVSLEQFDFESWIFVETKR